jgi:hypothetical protein
MHVAGLSIINAQTLNSTEVKDSLTCMCCLQGGGSKRGSVGSAAFKALLAANFFVMMFGGPRVFIVDAVSFTQHGLGLSNASNFWIVFRQPLLTVVLVGAQIVLSVSLNSAAASHAECFEFDHAAIYAHMAYMGQACTDDSTTIAAP